MDMKDDRRHGIVCYLVAGLIGLSVVAINDGDCSIASGPGDRDWYSSPEDLVAVADSASYMRERLDVLRMVRDTETRRQHRQNTRHLRQSKSSPSPNQRQHQHSCQRFLSEKIYNCTTSFVSLFGRHISDVEKNTVGDVDLLCRAHDEALFCLHISITSCTPSDEHLQMIADRIGYVRRNMQKTCLEFGQRGAAKVQPEKHTKAPNMPSKHTVKSVSHGASLATPTTSHLKEPTVHYSTANDNNNHTQTIIVSMPAIESHIEAEGSDAEGSDVEITKLDLVRQSVASREPDSTSQYLQIVNTTGEQGPTVTTSVIIRGICDKMQDSNKAALIVSSSMTSSSSQGATCWSSKSNFQQLNLIILIIVLLSIDRWRLFT